MAKRNFNEDALQVNISDYLRLQYPNLLFFHVANERKSSPAAGARLKRKGVLAGVADVIFVQDNKFYAIELKHGKNGTSDPQDDFAIKWQLAGGKYAICRSIDDVVGNLFVWGVHK